VAMEWPRGWRLGIGMAIAFIVALSFAVLYVAHALAAMNQASFKKPALELDSHSSSYMAQNMAQFFSYQPPKNIKTASKVMPKPAARNEEPTPPPRLSPVSGSPWEQQLQLWEAQAAEANAHGEYDRLARCETNSNWQFRSREYSGGIGIYNPAWNYFRLPGMPENAAQATKAQQIVVAERIRWEVPPKGSWAHGKWGCAGAAGLR
jgi:hypothetical protein